MSIKIGLLLSRVRQEEKLLLKEAENRNLNIIKIDSRYLKLGLNDNYNFDVILEREISHSRAIYALNMLNGAGIKTVNSYDVAMICGNKVITSKSLIDNNVPTPRIKVAFTKESALEAIEEMGYPVVLKPVVGSWGRLIAKVTDRAGAEAILEHKEYLGAYYHSIFYVQEYIEKPGRDIRAFVIGGETVGAVYRSSEHWITNTAKGAKTSKCELSSELNEICQKAGNAIGNGVLAIDLMESKSGFLVNEINYTVEFRNSIEPTGVNIPGKIIDYVISEAR
tara:strand:+ start:1154 stop:1993 length:840 start_codon:yes stop_codon:yes gene_type:complete